MSRSETEQILDALAENAARPLPEALSLPPAAYHSDELLQLERERMFYRGWLCVGRCAEIPQAGDFLAVDIISQAVLIIRQQDGSVQALPNVCLHRCSRLLQGSGHVSRISCPYHSWTYDLSGQLIGAPFMQKTRHFDVSDYRLQPYPCEVWEGFIYVSLNRNASPLGPELEPLRQEISDYRIADYVPVFEQQETWATNWKCLVENFMDVYHLHRVHAESFSKYASSEGNTEFFHGGDAYAYHFVQEDGGPHSVAAHDDNSWLRGDKRTRLYLINIFPAHVMQLQPDMLWYLSILPDGVDKVRIHWAVSIPREILDAAPDPDTIIRQQLDLLHQVNSEDKPAIESVFAATCDQSATQGPLSWLEQNVHDFCRYLARELCDQAASSAVTSGYISSKGTERPSC